MVDISKDCEALTRTLIELFNHDGSYPETEILRTAQAHIEQVGFDNWNGGTDIYGLYLEVPIDIYATYEENLKAIEEAIKGKLQTILRKYSNTWIGEVIVSPRLTTESKTPSQPHQISDKDILAALDAQRNLMISVSTGGPRIESVNHDYKMRRELINIGLSERGIDDPNPYSDLWEWYGKWSSGDLPSYQSRRDYINGLFSPVVKALKKINSTQTQIIFTRPSGWTRVDRSMGEIRTRLSQATTEEQFQAVGLLCRETLISLAQMVFNLVEHSTEDGVTPSSTDAKRMLDAYLAAKLPGHSNETARRHAKSSVDFANEVTHRRTADFRAAAMCAEATTAIVNLIAIISGQRDPQTKLHNI